MDIATRANDATKRVMTVVRTAYKDVFSEAVFKESELEWYDYFYDLLSDELDEDDLFGG